MRYPVLLLALIAGLTFTGLVSAQPSQLGHGVFPQIDYLRESALARDIRPEAVLQSGQWQAFAGQIPNFGYNADDAFWFRFPLSPASQAKAERTIEISYPQLDEVSFHLFENGRRVKTYTTGDRVAYSQRPVDHPHFLFPVTLEAGKYYQVLIRVSTEGALQVPIRVWETQAFFESASWQSQIHAVYFGVLTVIIVFNFFVYLTLRERTYLYYVLSTLSYLLLMATLRGLAYPLLWPESPWLQNQAMLLAIPFAILFSALFSRSFLNLRERNRWLDRAVSVSIWASLAAIAGTFLLDYSSSTRLSVALAVPSCLLLLLAGPVEWIRGNRAARLYTLAWAALSLGGALTAMSKYGLLPTNFVTEYGIQIGSALDAILLSLALARRLFEEREDKLEAQSARLREHAERRQAELKLMDQALHHPITGLPNRACLEMLIADLVRNQATGHHAVGVIQLLNYSTVYKTLGHTNTDRVIAEVARRFNRIVQDMPGVHVIERTEACDFHIATLESDAFAFVIDADSCDERQGRLDHCLEKLREPLNYLGMELSLDAATGVALYPDHGSDANNLIRQAYIAQENDQSKGQGLAYYSAERDFYSADRLTMVSDLKRALQQDELELYYQPKLALESHRIVGVEALIRWPGRAPEVNAETLIAVAEQTGLIKALTRWVLEQALAARTRFQAAGLELSVAVNVSPNNLREPDFPVFVQRLMTSHREHRGQIALELTETSMMLDPGTSLRVLRSLDHAGIPISIDDFGSGYSSLSYIKRLPAREIKIDRSLITDLCEHPDDKVIVQTTIDMCHSLGYRVVAEGVEDAHTLTVLKGMGCDQAQGYVLTPPLPFDRLVQWLRKREWQEQGLEVSP